MWEWQRKVAKQRHVEEFVDEYVKEKIRDMWFWEVLLRRAGQHLPDVAWFFNSFIDRSKACEEHMKNDDWTKLAKLCQRLQLDECVREIRHKQENTNMFRRMEKYGNEWSVKKAEVCCGVMLQ